MSGCGCGPLNRRLPEFIPRRIAVASVAGICALAWAAPASAYRPFDGTDAAVADVGEVEIEFQPIGALRAGPTKGLSDGIFNFGFADRWELVLQGTPQVLPVWSDQRLEWRILEIRVAARSSSGEVGSEHRHRIRSFITSCRRIGRRFRLGRYCVATVGLGNHSLECGNESDTGSA